nr:hypothetical protein [Sicyoidochytrium minutum DNA virus]
MASTHDTISVCFASYKRRREKRFLFSLVSNKGSLSEKWTQCARKR